MERRLTGVRRDSARVSGRTKPVSSRLNTAISASAPKITRQPPSRIRPLPNNGASMGDTLITSMIIAIRRVA